MRTRRLSAVIAAGIIATHALAMSALVTAAPANTLPLLAAVAGQDPPQAPATPPAAAQDDAAMDRLTRSVASQLRCVVCQGLSIEDSPSELAQEMRAVVREQLELGKSPAEVKQYFVERYGEWVLLEPEPAGFNLVVYILPVVMLLGGAAFVFVTARRMTRPPRPDADRTSESAAADEYEDLHA